MPALQVKDCPQETYEALKACAAAENRSISQQMLTIIQTYLSGSFDGQAGLRGGTRREANPEAERLARIQRRQRLFDSYDSRPKAEWPSSLPAVEDLVREMREERSNQLLYRIQQEDGACS